MPRKAAAVPIYKKTGGWYADLRRYSDVGGRRTALTHPGESQAVRDRPTAVKLCRLLVAQHEKARKERRTVGGPSLSASVGPFLVWKAEATSVSDRVLETHERNLKAATAFFEKAGPRGLETIRPHDVEQWLAHLRRTITPHDPERGVTASTLQDRLKSLSGLYQWAAYREFVPPGYNPARTLLGPANPTPERQEARFLQADTIALLLEAARITPAPQMAFQHALVATFAYTGARRREILGLQVEDVSFERGTVTFRPNRWRSLKTARSSRVVPLWPHLREILDDWLREAQPATLLFPQWIDGREQMLTDPKRLWSRLERAIKWKPQQPLDPPRLGGKGFRNGYAAARLQTLDRGVPVAMYTVAREMGHSTTRMLEDIYGHVGEVRARTEEVSFRVEAYPSNRGSSDRH